MWVLKKLVVRFGLKSFAERTVATWWSVLERLGREREEALLPGPIKGLAQFLLRVDTKVTPLTGLHVHGASGGFVLPPENGLLLKLRGKKDVYFLIKVDIKER